ncbi:hypothetical protein ISN76_11070 [Dyella halodurans]|uniref:YMGG-like Gly-zipper domain-containing protein n=1 Tax=Dyella halodurans TaxID=1920171 RepID=A0ABV9C2Q5_9GAMM|nr:hypothetical protein [Dyella halodurans]
MHTSLKLLTALLVCGTNVAISAQQLPAAYPAQGQNAEQQAADKNACASWAQSNAATQPVPAQQTGPAVGGGQRVAGAARGAAAGAVIGGAANGDAGHGAGVGAAAGVVAGGVRARQQRRADNAASANTQAQNSAAYGQAFGACMKGKGYTVN